MLSMALVLAACGGDDEETEATATSAAGEDRTSTTAGDGTAPEEQEDVAPLSVALGNNGVDVLAVVAEELGFFDEQGVDVELTCCPNATMANDLVAGTTDISLTAGSLGLAVAKSGQPVSEVYVHNGMMFSMIAGAPEVESMEDLAALDSCTIAGIVAGTSSHAMANFTNDEFDLGCEILELADPAAITAALGSGAADAISINPGVIAPLVDADQANILLDTRDPEVREELGGDQAVGVVSLGMRDNLEEKRESVVRYIKGLNEARDYIADHEPAEIAEEIADVDFYSGLSVDQVADIVANVAAHIDAVGDEGRIDEALWESTLDAYQNYYRIQGFDPSADAVSYEASVDMSYFDEAAG